MDSFIDYNRNDPAANLEEIFRCFICLGRVKNAQMCPSCSKMCCLLCIKKWLTEQRAQCPHCRAPLKISQLVNCRFVAEISQELDKLQLKNQLMLNNDIENSNSNPGSPMSNTQKKNEELCVQHKVVLYAYCTDCKTAICAECAMFSEIHKGHKFEHLQNVYDSYVESVKKEVNALRRRIKELGILMQSLDSNIERVQKAKDEKVSELRATFEQMQSRIDNQLKAKMLTLLEQKGALAEEIELLESMLHDINQQITSTPKSVFINICDRDEFTKMIQEIHRKPINQFVNASIPADDFTSELVPTYDSSMFQILNFSKICTNTSDENAEKIPSDVVYSESMKTSSGLTWRLKVYPNGNGAARGTYLSVFLELLNGLTDSAKYEYRVELLHPTNGNRNIKRQFVSDFQVGECWGYMRFFRIELLYKEGYLLPDKDELVLRFSVRAPTYYQLCKDQKRYIEHLEAVQEQYTELKHALEISRKKSAAATNVPYENSPRGPQVPTVATSNSTAPTHTNRVFIPPLVLSTVMDQRRENITVFSPKFTVERVIEVNSNPGTPPRPLQRKKSVIPEDLIEKLAEIETSARQKKNPSVQGPTIITSSFDEPYSHLVYSPHLGSPSTYTATKEGSIEREEKISEPVPNKVGTPTANTITTFTNMLKGMSNTTTTNSNSIATNNININNSTINTNSMNNSSNNNNNNNINKSLATKLLQQKKIVNVPSVSPVTESTSISNAHSSSSRINANNSHHSNTSNNRRSYSLPSIGTQSVDFSTDAHQIHSISSNISNKPKSNALRPTPFSDRLHYPANSSSSPPSYLNLWCDTSPRSAAIDSGFVPSTVWDDFVFDREEMTAPEVEHDSDGDLDLLCDTTDDMAIPQLKKETLAESLIPRRISNSAAALRAIMNAKTDSERHPDSTTSTSSPTVTNTKLL